MVETSSQCCCTPHHSPPAMVCYWLWEEKKHVHTRVPTLLMSCSVWGGGWGGWEVWLWTELKGVVHEICHIWKHLFLVVTSENTKTSCPQASVGCQFSLFVSTAVSLPTAVEPDDQFLFVWCKQKECWNSFVFMLLVFYHPLRFL